MLEPTTSLPRLPLRPAGPEATRLRPGASAPLTAALSTERKPVRRHEEACPSARGGALHAEASALLPGFHAQERQGSGSWTKPARGPRGAGAAGAARAGAGRAPWETSGAQAGAGCSRGLPRGKAAPVRAPAAPPEAASLPAEVGPVPLPSAAGRGAAPAPAAGSPPAPIGFRLGRGRLGPKPLDLLGAARQVGVGGAEVGRVGLRVVVAVGQRGPDGQPAWKDKRSSASFAAPVPQALAAWDPRGGSWPQPRQSPPSVAAAAQPGRPWENDAPPRAGPPHLLAWTRTRPSDRLGPATHLQSALGAACPPLLSPRTRDRRPRPRSAPQPAPESRSLQQARAVASRGASWAFPRSQWPQGPFQGG